jgi:eukaryotic-like serine/threonine-protein kinase
MSRMRMQLAGGQRLGHYDIVAPIGAGGMGAVYRAHDTMLRRTVAIKVLHDDLAGEARAQLLREARAVSALSHPHICAVHNVEEAEGFAFIVMEHVAGRTLQALAGRALPAPQVQRYGMQIARALDHAHAHGIVHRDLKSANIMITDEDDVVVLDFGIAAQTGEQRGRGLTSTLADASDGAGTVAYMAPERLRGSPGDARSDIWALGIVLYEMAAGAMPFVGETPFVVSAAILDQPAQPLSESVPAPLRRMIDRCLQKDPARRYQTAGEIVAALDVGETPTRRDARWGTGRWALAVAGVVIAALLALVAVTRREPVATLAATGVQSVAILPLNVIAARRRNRIWVSASPMPSSLVWPRCVELRFGLRRRCCRTRHSHPTSPPLAPPWPSIRSSSERSSRRKPPIVSACKWFARPIAA